MGGLFHVRQDFVVTPWMAGSSPAME